jgi:hypothetical protein
LGQSAFPAVRRSLVRTSSIRGERLDTLGITERFLMSILRLFTRTTAIIFTTATLLVGGTMLASGAFRPVRFFLIRPNDFSIPPTVAIFETGEVYPFAPPEEEFWNSRVGTDIISWINQRDELVYWQNGRRQTIGKSLTGWMHYTHWSLDNPFAWVSPQTGTRTSTPPIKDIGLWDGTETTLISRNASEIKLLTWMSDHRLWWIEQKIGATDWQIMQWDGLETTVLFENIRSAESVGIIDCGVIWFGKEAAADPFRLWNGTMTLIPLDEHNPIRYVDTRDCQTFHIGNMSENFIWNGTQLHRFPFEEMRYLDSIDIYFGVERPLEDGDWTLHLWQNGQVLQSIAVPESRFFVNEPGFASYALDPQTILVAVSRAYKLGSIYRWNSETNELISITGEYEVRDTSGGLALEVFGPETDRRLAWCGGLPQESTNTVYQWEARTGITTPIQANALCTLNAMSDGSLLGTMSSGPNMSEMFFRWDGQTIHYFPKNYQFDDSSSIYIFPDWMYWE